MADKLVTIARFSTAEYVQAELAKQRLEEFNIKACVVGWNAANVFGDVPVIGGLQLQVFDTQAQQAKQILEQQSQSQNPLEPADD